MENVNPEIINEIKRIEEIGKKVDRNKMLYKGTNKTYNFRNFKTIRAYVISYTLLRYTLLV